MNIEQVMDGLRHGGLNPELYSQENSVSIVKLTDYIYLNMESDEEMVRHTKLYSELKVSDSVEQQAAHTGSLIQSIEVLTGLLTQGLDKQRLYKAMDIYGLGNNQDIVSGGYRCRAGTAKGLFYYTIDDEG